MIARLGGRYPCPQAEKLLLKHFFTVKKAVIITYGFYKNSIKNDVQQANSP